MTSKQLKKVTSTILVGFGVVFCLSLFALGGIGIFYYVFDKEPSHTTLITVCIAALIGFGGLIFVGITDLLFRASHVPDDEPIDAKSICIAVVVSLIIVGGIFYSICS